MYFSVCRFHIDTTISNRTQSWKITRYSQHHYRYKWLHTGNNLVTASFLSVSDKESNTITVTSYFSFSNDLAIKVLFFPSVMSKLTQCAYLEVIDRGKITPLQTSGVFAARSDSPWLIVFSRHIASLGRENSPPWKLLRLDVLLLLLSAGGFGFAMGYRQNSWPSNASDDSCCLFFASRIARGNVSCTGSSSLLAANRNRPVDSSYRIQLRGVLSPPPALFFFIQCNLSLLMFRVCGKLRCVTARGWSLVYGRAKNAE